MIKMRRLVKAKSNAFWYQIECVTLIKPHAVQVDVSEIQSSTTEMRMKSGHQYEILGTGDLWVPINKDMFDKIITAHKRRVIVRKANTPL
jgi:hypothetical protein